MNESLPPLWLQDGWRITTYLPRGRTLATLLTVIFTDDGVTIRDDEHLPLMGWRVTSPSNNGKGFRFRTPVESESANLIRGSGAKLEPLP